MILHKETPVSGDRDCILQYFLKKACSGAVTKTYNLSTVLDLNLVIENKFYLEVLHQLDQESDVLGTGALMVSGGLVESCEFSAHLLQGTVTQTQPGRSIVLSSQDVVRVSILLGVELVITIVGVDDYGHSSTAAPEALFYPAYPHTKAAR